MLSQLNHVKLEKRPHMYLGWKKWDFKSANGSVFHRPHTGRREYEMTFISHRSYNLPIEREYICLSGAIYRTLNDLWYLKSPFSISEKIRHSFICDMCSAFDSKLSLWLIVANSPCQHGSTNKYKILSVDKQKAHWWKRLSCSFAVHSIHTR